MKLFIYLLKYICSMIDELLTGIGLSSKESRMYVTLLRHGTQPTSILAKRAGFNRGTAYVILHALLERGLVTKMTKSKVQYFGPLSPHQLVAYLDHQEQELRDRKAKVQASMGQLLAISNPLAAQPKIQFFEGAQGARTVLESTLESPEKLLRAYLSIADISAFAGVEFFRDYTAMRIKKGFKLLAIRTQEKDRKARTFDKYAKKYVTSRAQRREVRHVSDALAFPMTIYIYGDRIGIISSKEESFAVIIESKELADMQRRLFDLLWVSLKR